MAELSEMKPRSIASRLGGRSATVGMGQRWGSVLCWTWAFEVRSTGSRKWRNEKEVKPLKTLDSAK